MGIKAIMPVSTVAKVSGEHVFSYQNMVKIKTDQPIQNEYQFIQKIGQGSYAEVFKAKSILTGNIRAIKRINKSKNPSAKSSLLNEFDILKEMDHTNILKMYEIYEEDNYFYIVTELCVGKELFDCIVEEKRFKQSDACEIFFEIVSAVKTLHDHKIMHRDLKPQNIMYSTRMKTLKLIDFGSAIPYESSQPVTRKRIGTSYYIAPEVLHRKYNEKCDIWSLGVILYILLSGQPPFRGANDTQILKNVINNEVQFTRPIWKKISNKAKDLLKGMIQKNVNKRLSAQQVLQHNWVRQFLAKKVYTKRQQKTIMKYLSNMKIYQQIDSNPIQQGLLIFIINFVKNSNDHSELTKVFKALDINGDGVLSLHQLKLGMARYMKLGERQSLYVAKKIFQRVDINNSGFVDFSEFILSASSIQLVISEQNIDIAFDYIDIDKSGCLSVHEIREKLGNNLTQETYNELLKEFDKNHDGQISRDEFRDMMKKLLRKRKPVSVDNVKNNNKKSPSKK